jgi:uncharacterized membrane protein YidH (DUF202 family)
MARTDEDTARERGFRPQGLLIAVVGAALAVLGPSIALGARAIRSRTQPTSRMPGLAAIPVIGGLVAVAGAIAWRNRERVRSMADDTFAAAQSLAEKVGEAVEDEWPAAPGSLAHAPMSG